MPAGSFFHMSGNKKQTLFTGIGVGLSVGCLDFLLVMFKGDLLAGFFTTDAPVIQRAFEYLRGFGAETIVTAILFSMIGLAAPISTTVGIVLNVLYYLHLNRKVKVS